MASIDFKKKYNDLNKIVQEFLINSKISRPEFTDLVLANDYDLKKYLEKINQKRISQNKKDETLEIKLKNLQERYNNLLNAVVNEDKRKLAKYKFWNERKMKR